MNRHAGARAEMLAIPVVPDGRAVLAIETESRLCCRWDSHGVIPA
jgi:hypothetical protein